MSAPDPRGVPSLWTECPTVHMKPLQGLFGFDMFDFIVLVVLLVGCYVLYPLVGLPPWASLLFVLVAAGALWKGKRGKARGAIQHGMHEWDAPPLPGLLPAVEQPYHHWS
jgi:hypothetical protein